MRKLLFGALSIVISSGLLLFTDKPDNFFHMYLLDVGQGDAIFFRAPDGTNMLVDGGPGTQVMNELGEVLPFFDTTIDYVALTHPDRDHLEGLISVLKKYDVKHVLFTGVYKNDYFSKAFFRAINGRKIPVTIVDADSDFTLGGDVRVDILFPFRALLGPQEEANSSSLMAKVTYGKNDILLTSDSEAEEEETLMKNRVNLDADILKIAHHGSKTSTTEEFLKKVTPEYAAISVGTGNSYNHPHPSVMRRLQKAGIKTHRTDQEGRIEFVMDQERVVEIKTAK